MAVVVDVEIAAETAMLGRKRKSESGVPQSLESGAARSGKANDVSLLASASLTAEILKFGAGDGRSLQKKNFQSVGRLSR